MLVAYSCRLRTMVSSAATGLIMLLRMKGLGTGRSGASKDKMNCTRLGVLGCHVVHHFNIRHISARPGLSALVVCLRDCLPGAHCMCAVRLLVRPGVVGTAVLGGTATQSAKTAFRLVPLAATQAGVPVCPGTWC